MQTIRTLNFMTKEESYADRRQLFKDIWDTAMNIDEKDDILTKPKVIKTLRLDEVDKCIAGKFKKQRLKNLRHVCNKILAFCDRQDADYLNYEKMAAEGQVKSHQNKDETPKKKKAIRLKRKIKKPKSLFTPLHDSIAEVNSTVSEEKEELSRSKTSRNTSPNRIGRTPHVRISPYTAHNIVKSKKGPKNTAGDDLEGTKGDASVSRRRIVKKKSSKRKKVPTTNLKDI